jgi:hypothetical protein
MTLLLGSTTLLVALFFSQVAGADEPKPGRVTAMAAVIWACPLENWRLGQDDGCDPIETGTAIKIHRRGVRPEYPHGPFALIEYTVNEKTKIQYVIDNTVTPIGEDDPTVEDILERERKRFEENERKR